MVSRTPFAVGVMLIALWAGSPAAAQSDLRTTVELGRPPVLRLDTRYSDPVDLFPRLEGTLVFPLSIDVQNISAEPQLLDVQSLRLTLGNRVGARVTLAPMDPDAAEQQLRDDVKLNPALKTIFTQPGPFTPNPFRRHLESGRLAAGKSRGGFVFFLKPAGFAFDGFMALGTTSRPPELLPTSLIRTAGTITRSGSPTLTDSVYSLIAKLPGGPTVVDAIRGRPFGQSYALLFGVSTYDDPSYNLAGTASDIKRMHDYLMRQGFDQVVTVSDRAVTESALRNVQMHFAARITPQDRLLVYYAGHGQRAEGGAAYMLLSRGTRVSMADCMTWIRSVKVKHLLVLLDACYAGSVIGATPRDVFANLDSPTFDKFLRLTSEGSRFIITAGGANDLANEHPRWDGGLFTTAVLRALQPKGDRTGLVTTHQMFASLKDFMIDEVRKYKLASQTPLIQDLGYSSDGKSTPGVSQGEFVFVSGR
jgi:hypothetical protein